MMLVKYVLLFLYSVLKPYCYYLCALTMEEKKKKKTLLVQSVTSKDNIIQIINITGHLPKMTQGFLLGKQRCEGLCVGVGVT